MGDVLWYCIPAEGVLQSAEIKGGCEGKANCWDQDPQCTGSHLVRVRRRAGFPWGFLRITEAKFAPKLFAEVLERAQILSVVFISLYGSTTRQSDAGNQ